MGFGVWGLGFRVQGLGFRVSKLPEGSLGTPHEPRSLKNLSGFGAQSRPSFGARNSGFRV